MTPTEQDKELSKLLAYIDGSSDYNGAWFGEIPDGRTGRYWWRSELKQLITADRKRVALEARIDEMDVALAEVTHWSIDDSDSAIHGYGKHRIAELKAQQEEV